MPHARQSPLYHVTVLFVRRCIATAGFVSFAGDLSLLFPVDIRNARVYVKAAEAVEAREMMRAEELLGSAGLWAAAAEMYRVYGSQDDFARIASAHAPHLLKSDSKQQHRSSEQRSSVSQPDRANIPTGTNSDAQHTDSSSHAASAARPAPAVAFPSPPSPVRSGLLRARFFIPGKYSYVRQRMIISLVSACSSLWCIVLRSLDRTAGVRREATVC